jgi:hypothetical protein
MLVALRVEVTELRVLATVSASTFQYGEPMAPQVISYKDLSLLPRL